ncbi:sugar ABC transporter substrate-binding protein [Arcanobacterium pinnipediorum]|uniref:Extracellular solute-binding protein n=1 Tax=Arcanobacterium pinnipediorum TaxID=1503041 RepID=A0ABY5AI16_9ACTO|nr:extracellular solute-binding protein [Arcanobacterium pinnipediorum]USR79732.1 extracellular solute-binding protein [Arcanobacterium pinnipediorum]
MRRGIALLAITGMAIAGLTGCGSSDSGKASDNSTASESPSTDAALTVWVDDNRKPAFEIAAQKYEEETGNKVELVVKENDQIRSEFAAQVPTGKGPDITFGAHDWLGEFVTNGIVAPIELGDKASEFSDIALKAFSYDGQTYGVPYAVENIAIIRNADLAKDPTPATFDEMIAAGKATGAPTPFMVQVDEKGDPFHMYPFESSFSGPVFKTDADGNYTPELNLGGEKGEAFAQWLGAKAAAGELSAAWTYDIVVEAFKKGEVPFILGGPWMLGDFKGMNISVDPIPAAGDMPAAPFVGVQGGFISAKSENQLLATDFLVNYVGSEEVQDALYEAGQRTPALKASATKIESDPVAAGFARAGQAGLPMPSLPQMGSVWSFWGATEAQIIGGADPVATWQKMITDIENEIAAK